MPCSRRAVFGAREYSGGVAQLGERVNGIHEVRGSIPLASTARLGDRYRVRKQTHRGQPYTGDRLKVRFGRQRGNSSVGRAQPCQGWGRGFESRFPLCARRVNGSTAETSTRGGAVW